MIPNQVIAIDFPFVYDLIGKGFFYKKGTDIGKIAREAQARDIEPFYDLLFGEAFIHKQAMIHMEENIAFFHTQNPSIKFFTWSIIPLAGG